MVKVTEKIFNLCFQTVQGLQFIYYYLKIVGKNFFLGEIISQKSGREMVQKKLNKMVPVAQNFA